MIAVWILVVVLATGNAYTLEVDMAACMEAPAKLRAGDPIGARMSDGSVEPIVAAVCMGPAEQQPREGAGS